MASQLFARKPYELLVEEMKDDNRLRRILGPVQLTSLGVGAIIGAGIFVATGAAAHNVAGPALMLSYVVAGFTCLMAALCYAEFAAMTPVAGSAYTYAYTTLGELFAWIIGWDLILEYAVGASTVANGWSSYFREVLGIFVVFPMRIAACIGFLQMKRWGHQWLILTCWTGVLMWVGYVANMTMYADIRYSGVVFPVIGWWLYDIFYITPFVALPYLHTVNREIFSE